MEIIISVLSVSICLREHWVRSLRGLLSLKESFLWFTRPVGSSLGPGNTPFLCLLQMIEQNDYESMIEENMAVLQP